MFSRLMIGRWQVVVLTTLSLVFIACGSGGNGGRGGSAVSVSTPSDLVTTAPVTVNQTPSVVNLPSGLTVAFNTRVLTGGPRNLVWNDEFDGTQLEPDDWFAETGDGSQYGLVGWGNNELQWYLPANAQVANGLLTITAQRESQGGYNYTSARVNTRDRFAFRFGRIEARIRLPGGQGLWPAFWLLPQDNNYGTWAASGEIDVMEAVNLGGTGGNEVHGTIHFGGPWPATQFSGQSYSVASSATGNFHVYAVEWDATEIRWYVDGVLYGTKNAWSSTGGPYPAPFNQPFYILLNVAIGGNWPGAPDMTTNFPVSMEVDYVRVYSGD